MSAPSTREGAQPTGTCKHCGRRTYGGATSCKSRLCDRYAPLWAGDWRRVLFDNLARLGELVPNLPPGLEARAVMLAVTAPGEKATWDPVTGEVFCEGLPFDRASCTHPPDVACSGRDHGCRVHPLKAAAWNLTFEDRWSKLWRAAATATRRKFGNDSLVMLCRALEMQHRGVKHAHPVLLAATPKQREAVKFCRDYLAERAPRYGFGYVSMKLSPQSAKSAAAYLSSYFVQGKREKAQLQHTVQHPAMRKSRLLWMTPKLTMKTGVTMRELRFRRFVWMRYGSFVATGGKWVDVARRLAEIEVERGRELTGEEVVELIGQCVVNDWAIEAIGKGVVSFEPHSVEVVERAA